MEKGERTSTGDDNEPTASGAGIETGEAILAVRQRYSGQSGVEHASVLRDFSLLQASQHDFADAARAGSEANEERPVNTGSTTSRRRKLAIFKYADCMNT